MASLRNLAIGILRRQGHRNIAAALRRNARDATRVLPLLGITRAVPLRVAVDGFRHLHVGGGCESPGYGNARFGRLPHDVLDRSWHAA